MLHVPDEGVVPVEEVQRAIWSELEVHRAEVRIAGADEVAGQGAGEPGSVFAHRAEVETQEPNAVAGHELTLAIFREMPRGDEFRARGGPRPLGHILAGALDFHAIRHLGRDGQTPVILAAGGIGQHALLPVVEGDAPGVVDVALDGALQAEVLRIEAPGAAVVHALRTIGRLDLAVQEAALEQIERARGVGAVGRNRVVRVMRVEAVHEDFQPVRLVVVVGVDQQAEVGFLREIHTLGGQLETDGQVQVAGEDRLLVGLSVVIGVFEDDELVIGPGITRSVVRVAGHHRDPEASLVVEGHLHRVLQVGELLLGGEELDLVAGHYGHLLDGLLAIEIVHRALKIGGHLRQGAGLGVVRREVLALAGGDLMNDLVAQGHHLAGLEDFGRIILWAEGIVALAVRVHAVDQVVVVVPEEVLVEHRLVDELRVGLRCFALTAEGAVGEHYGQFLIAQFRGREPIDGQRGQGLLVQAGLRGREEIDEGESAPLGHRGHGLGIQGQIGVLLLAVRQIAFGRQIFEGDGRDEHQSGGGRAIVGFGERVRDPGVEFGLEVTDLVRAVERLVVPEEANDRVGLQMREPLVGCGIESTAEMRIQVGMEFFRAGKGPLRNAARVRAESRGVTGPAHVAHDEVQFGIAQVQFSLQAAEVHVALGQSVADEDDALAG